jgi:ketosteroid isomerase-like protein
MTQDRMTELRRFASRYTAAWCSQDAGSVAAFFSTDGSLTINGGTPAVGRAAIAEAAQAFMTAFPDLMVYMDDLLEERGKIVYKWTLEGTNTGPGGAGKPVRISGFEQWRIGDDALIAESLGSFDAAESPRQVEHGAGHR